MLRRIYAIFVARNREFLRDRGTLAWNIVMPVILVAGLALAFGGEGRTQFTVGVLQAAADIDETQHPFLDLRYIEFVAIDDAESAFRKVERHQLDLLVTFGDGGRSRVGGRARRGELRCLPRRAARRHGPGLFRVGAGGYLHLGRRASPLAGRGAVLCGERGQLLRALVVSGKKNHACAARVLQTTAIRRFGARQVDFPVWRGS